MPRQPRLDAPDTLHHVMVRGIERRTLFRDDRGRADFVARLAALAEAKVLGVYAWALLPNHAHLLVRTGIRPLARAMRSLLTGYAGTFNRRHKRVGHLFQNRYMSVVVEAERYLLELVRYLHLNPLRAKVVPDLRTLDRYPWTGHSALLGHVPRPWHASGEILAQFGPTARRARLAYRAFVAAGIPQGRRPELEGGGLLRSLGGWQAVTALRRGRADFVARLAALAEAKVLGVYAWALLPNHAHLLVRTGIRPLARAMRSLLTGYAGTFNRRHKRVGHLFQNRYMSVVVEAERYLLELVRYLHLNPLRAKVVPDLRTLDRYPWTGHSALLGHVPRPWHASGEILAQFGPTARRARLAYRAFVAAGIPQGRRPELEGGGLLRSLGGWQAVTALRRGREAYTSDERILGSSEFVDQFRQAMEAETPPAHPECRSRPSWLASAGRSASRPRSSPAAAARWRCSAPGRGSPTCGWPSSGAPAGLSPPISACNPPRSSRRPSGAPRRHDIGVRSWPGFVRSVRMQRPQFRGRMSRGAGGRPDRPPHRRDLAARHRRGVVRDRTRSGLADGDHDRRAVRGDRVDCRRGGGQPTPRIRRRDG